MDIFDYSVEAKFPKIKQEGYKVTSPQDPQYNCIAWAADVNTSWYEPDPFNMYSWPTKGKREYSLEAYIDIYKSIGYELCNSHNLEEDYEKVAIYTDSNSNPTHAAKQLESGTWTSKLGPYKDIQHQTLEALEGTDYGHSAVILKRAK